MIDMDLDSLRHLQTSLGQTLLAEAMQLAPDESSFLSCFKRLSKHGPRELVRAALDTAMLRQRASVKFRLADRMFFQREALEQASSEIVARHRARRFSRASLIGDLCCGIGGDALALAEVAPIVAVDRDPLRLEMARLNVAVYGHADRADFVVADVLNDALPNFDAVFVDPSRRVGGKRVISTHACEPSLPDLIQRFGSNSLLGVKLAPGLPLRELTDFDAEVEFVSLNGELKECVLWFGPGRTTIRRATLLPTGETLTASGSSLPPATDPGDWLYDPDPAIIRAGLVGELAELLEARPLDPGIGLLTSQKKIPTPFARRYPIETTMIFHLQRLREYLRERHVGRVQFIRRGSLIEPAELERKLKLNGDEFRSIVLTRAQGRQCAVILLPMPPEHELA